MDKEQLRKFWVGLSPGGRAIAMTLVSAALLGLSCRFIGLGWTLLWLLFLGILLAVYRIANYGWIKFWRDFQDLTED